MGRASARRRRVVDRVQCAPERIRFGHKPLYFLFARRQGPLQPVMARLQGADGSGQRALLLLARDEARREPLDIARAGAGGSRGIGPVVMPDRSSGRTDEGHQEIEGDEGAPWSLRRLRGGFFGLLEIFLEMCGPTRMVTRPPILRCDVSPAAARGIGRSE